MTHEYVYTFDTVYPPHDKLGTLPLYGVSCSDFLQIDSIKNGNFTGTIRLDTAGYTPQRILDMTIPGKTRIWIERDQQLVWGGLLWSRTYQSDGRSLQLSGQTFTSYLNAVVVRERNEEVFAPNNGLASCFSYVGYSSTPAASHLRLPWDFFRGASFSSGFPRPRYDIGVTIGSSNFTGQPSIVFYYSKIGDRKYFQDGVQELLKLDCEFRIRISYGTTGTRLAQIDVHKRGGLGNAEAQAGDFSVLKYPGAISKYWMTDSAATAASEVFGQGNQGLISYGVNAIYSENQIVNPLQFVGLDLVKNYGLDDQTSLDVAVQRDANRLGPPVVNPVYELAGDDIPFDFHVGDRRRVVIDDPYRYPSGTVGGAVRIVGWQLTPGSGESVERIALTIDDPTKLVTLGV